MSKRVVIIGGGFSGLAAGVALVEQGHEVTLLERRKQLGGRAYSYIDPQTGDVVDNGQHLFMRCYRHTVSFLEKIGSADKLKFQDSPRIDFLDRETGYTSFDCPSLPAPMHVIAGLLRMGGISVGDKLRALKMGGAIRGGRARLAGPGSGLLTVSEWLDRLGQSRRIKERFWYPMAIATLNESPEIASANMMKRVLQEAFGGDRTGTSIGISSVGLSDLYANDARLFIESRGARVRTGAHVHRLVLDRGRVMAVELKGGEQVAGDTFISTVTPAALLQILPGEILASDFAYLGRLESSPIVSINLWFDRPVVDRKFIGLLGTRIQWLFNKDLTAPGEKASNQIAVIISAARDFVDWTRPALVEMALEEMRALIPESRKAILLHSAIVKEREATLSHTVESDLLRPGGRTSIPNLILAGDWTATGLPATIESAVISGNTAAEIVKGDA